MNEIPGLKSFGQAERLTDRIRDLIEGYCDGLEVFKELIQNADDANASEISICLDLRNNLQWNTSLFHENLKSLQGNALWIFNNAFFTQNDYQSIIRLGGREKAKRTGTIGKFGLGFNSVYNITDMPSILSRNNLVMFDPNEKYLPKEWIKKEPGVMIDLTYKKDNVRYWHDQYNHQLQPYDNMFGYKIFEDDECKGFNGTLFRLPFRTEPSDISSTIYTKERAEEIVEILRKYANCIILFTQNICNLKFFVLNDDQTPENLNLIFEIDKSPERFISKHNIKLDIAYFTNDERRKELIEQSNILKLASKRLELGDNENEIIITFIQKIKSTTCEISQSNESYWFQAIACYPRSKDFEDEKDYSSYYPCVSISIKLNKSNNSSFKISDTSIDSGIAFCFLPLNKKTNFKFHVNGNFFLSTTREDILASSNERINVSKFKWNNMIKSLMADTLIKCIQSMYNQVEYETNDILDIWPIDAVDDFKILQHDFTIKVFDYNKKIKFFKHNNQLYSIDRCKIMRLSFEYDICLMIQNLIQKLEGDDYYFLILPIKILNYLDENSVKLNNVIDDVKVCRLFLSHINQISYELHIKFLKYILEAHCYDYRHSALSEIGALICNTACIPSNISHELFKPCELVNPRSRASELFDANKDNVFPTNDIISNQNCNEILLKMGMINEYLPSRNILNRINVFMQSDGYNKSDENAIDYSWKLISHYLATLSLENQIEIDKHRNDIKNAKFLKAKTSNNSKNGLKWYADSKKEAFWSLSELYEDSSEDLICWIRPIFDSKKLDNSITQATTGLSKLQLKKASSDDIIEQSKEIQINWNKMKNLEKEDIGKSIYTYFIKFIKYVSNIKTVNINSSLLPINIFMQGGESYDYFKPSEIAINVTYPSYKYILKISPELSKELKLEFLKRLGIQDRFSKIYLLDVIKQIFEDYKNNAVEPNVVNLLIEIVKEFDHLGYLPDEPDEEISKKIYLPDKQNFLRPCEKLCFTDASKQWLKEGKINIVNDKVPIGIAKKLGIKNLQQQYLHRFKNAIDFGQEEPLKYRIKKLLDSYPNFFDILKELLQNADDANATRVSFILDARIHSKEKIFGNEFSALQGPALCFYNNQIFSDKDFEALKTLGVGNKSEDKAKIGKYGVGFNTVYHLTDAPQILSNLNDYVIFDPLCKHFPDLKSNSPGCRIKVNVEDVNDNPLIEYSDVIQSFLGEFGDKKSLINGTMFRFALRCKESDLSKYVFPVDDIEKRLRGCVDNLIDSMLFLKNVKELKLIKISENNNIEVIAHHEIKFPTQEDQLKQSNYVKYFYENIKNNNIFDIPKQVFSYDIKIVEKASSNHQSQSFRIINQIGFQKPINIGNTIALNNNYDMKLMPIAGVALKIENLNEKYFQKNGNLYCFLPLPIKTPLPIHINGYFALINESRQGLYKTNDMDNFKNKWNECIFNYIVSNLLIEALKYIKIKFKSDYESNPALIETHYVNYFPAKQEETMDKTFIDILLYWPKLIESFYDQLSNVDDPLIPIYQQESNLIVEWLSIKDNKNSLHHEIPFKNFCNGVDVLSSILIYYGLKLCTFNKLVERINNGLNDRHAFKAITGNDIIAILKKNSTIMLNKHISETKFKSSDILGLLINFCIFNISESFINKEIDKKKLPDAQMYKEIGSSISMIFNDCPLLLNNDNIIRKFSTYNPTFAETEADIFEDRAFEFLHSDHLRVFVNYDHKYQFKFIKRLDISNLSRLLPYVISETKYKFAYDKLYSFQDYPKLITEKEEKTDINAIKLEKLQKIIKNCLWRFEGNESKKKKDLFNFLQPLFDWCLVPVSFESCNYKSIYLAPLAALKFTIDWSTKPDLFPNGFIQFFQKCDLPCLTQIYNREELHENFKTLTINLSRFEDILALLTEINAFRRDIFQKLTADIRNQFLKYLMQNEELFKSDSVKQKLFSLPLFTNAFEQACSIDDKTGVVISNEIPLNGLENVFPMSKYFLATYNKNLENVYNILELQYVGVDSFYQTYVERLDQVLDNEAKFIHMDFVKGEFKKDRISKDTMIALASFKFVKAGDGKAYKASDLHDPRETVFSILLRNVNNAFPTFPYNSDDWYSFLLELNLKDQSFLENIDVLKKFFELALDQHSQSKIFLNELLTVLARLNRIMELEVEIELNEEKQILCTELETIIVNSITFLIKELKKCELLSAHVQEIENCLISFYAIINKLVLVVPESVHKFKNIDLILHQYTEKWSNLTTRIIWKMHDSNKFVENNLSNKDEIEGYLYNLPTYAVAYNSLFRLLGLNNEVDFELCIKLLQIIQNDMQNKLFTNEVLQKSALQAMNLLFKQAPSTNNHELSQLYLLNGSLELKNSSELFYIDKLNLEHLFKSDQIKNACLISFEEFKKYFSEHNYMSTWKSLIQKLNFKLQPKPLSKIITSRMILNENELKIEDTALQTKLSNKSFIQTFKAILDLNNKINDEELSNYLTNIKVYTINSIKTEKLFKNEKIENSELEVLYHTQYDSSSYSLKFYFTSPFTYAKHSKLARAILNGLIKYFNVNDVILESKDMIIELLMENSDFYTEIYNQKNKFLNASDEFD